MGGICYRLAGLNRMGDNKNEEIRFTKNAIDLYGEAYSVEDFNDGNSIKPEIVLYLLGELNHRLGNFQASQKWFGIAIMDYCNKPQTSPNISKMIRDRWVDIRSQQRNIGKGS